MPFGVPSMQFPKEERHDIRETFADSLSQCVFDGQTLRLELCSTRLDEAKPPPAKPTGRRHVVARIVLTPGGAVELFNACRQLADQFKQAGILKEGREIAFPFLDEAVVSASLAFKARVRFAAGGRTKPVVKAALAAGTSREFVDRPKLSGGFPSALFEEMRSGSLADLVRSIQPPGFVSRELFEHKKERPDWFTWNLLTFDLWEKLVLRARETSPSATGRSSSESL